MAKPTQPPSGWMPADSLRLRGKVYTRVLNGQLIIQTWPQPRGRPTSVYQQAWGDWFSAAARASKTAYSDVRDELEEQVRGTGWYWRDIIERAMAGKLIVYRWQYRVSVPTFSVRQSSTQAPTNGVALLATYNTVDWDNNAFTLGGGTTNVTIRTSGLYLVQLWIQYTTTGATGARAAWINSSAGPMVASDTRVGVTGGTINQMLTALAYLVAGTVLNVGVQCNQASQQFRMAKFQITGITPEAVL